MRPLVRSEGDNSRVTLSPASTRMRLRRSRPARWASTTRSWSIWTLNLPLGNFSKTVPVTSILSSLLIDLRGGFAGGGRPDFLGRPRPHLLLAGRDVGCLQPLRTARYFELHTGAFIQASVTFRLDGREMHEDVFSVLPLDEAVSFGCIKPLHCTFFSHSMFPLPIVAD